MICPNFFNQFRKNGQYKIKDDITLEGVEIKSLFQPREMAPKTYSLPLLARLYDAYIQRAEHEQACKSAPGIAAAKHRRYTTLLESGAPDCMVKYHDPQYAHGHDESLYVDLLNKYSCMKKNVDGMVRKNETRNLEKIVEAFNKDIKGLPKDQQTLLKGQLPWLNASLYTSLHTCRGDAAGGSSRRSSRRSSSCGGCE